MSKCLIPVLVSNHVDECHWPSPTTICFSLGTLVMNDPFIMNDAKELFLWLNGFSFPTKRNLSIRLLVFFMPFEFQFVFLVINIVFSNFRIHFLQGPLNYAFGKGSTFYLDTHIGHIEMTFPFQSWHNKLKIFQYFSSFLIYNHTHMTMKIVRTNLMHHLICT